MRLNRFLLAALLITVSCSSYGQVLSPLELRDPAMRRLQQQYMNELKFIASDLNQHSFPYPFYFSHKLDIDEVEQAQIDQRSIRFEVLDSRVALEITGNYYASYLAEKADADHRARQTFIDVILPILQAAVLRLQEAPEINVFAVEVSHHVRRKVMGVDSEYAENTVVVVPRDLAIKVVQTKDLNGQQQLLLDAEVYNNGEPTVLWLTGEKPVLAETPPRGLKGDKQEIASLRPTVRVGSSPPIRSQDPLAQSPTIAATTRVPAELRETPLHDSSPAALKILQKRQTEAIKKMLSEMNATAHFVYYAPPTFIAFKQGAYLQIPVTTTLDASASGSQYKLAALAFDRHVSHLLRPVFGYFADAIGFDGIDFSTTVKVANGEKEPQSVAVEFILPLTALRCYQQYDCTGQQVLNAGYILINGERAGLELQTAASVSSK